ncbi:MAG: hypothetical protein KKE64_06015, partial [Candidatus Omnitrophica bacterium]|nr:hypothetical protein [Candidatus Omnitrophota bacterium]
IDFIPKYGIEIYPFGFIFVIMMASIIAFAILKYRLMDIRVVITRTGIFIAVYAAVLGIPFVIATWFQGLLLRLFSSNWWVFPLGVMALLATAGPFVYIFLVRKAEDILFRDQRHYQNTLRELSKTLIRIRDLDQLSKAIVLTIANTVKTSFAAIYLKEEESKSYRLKQFYPETTQAGLDDFISYDSVFVKSLERHKRPFTSEEISAQKPNSEVGLIIPCLMEDDLLGFMVLGVKPNNQAFSPDDILIFETFSYSASLAIENCIFWREIEDRHRKARLQEMDTFSYSLAHEIDNPMTFVYNLAKFLKSHFVKYISDIKEREEVEEMCDIIKEGSQRVMGMVKAIRQFGQKTSGELEPLNLQETVEGFFKLYTPELKANFVLFSKELPGEPIYVKGVAAELQQVLIILAKNALHAMQSSQAKQLTLKLSKVNHNTARVEVTDTGYGISKESLHTIFEPFFTTKASSEGTGMGLHNAKGFIIRYKGRIWAESEGKDRGSTFIFELPIIEWQGPLKQEEKGKTEWAY